MQDLASWCCEPLVDFGAPGQKAGTSCKLRKHPEKIFSKSTMQRLISGRIKPCVSGVSQNINGPMTGGI